MMLNLVRALGALNDSGIVIHSIRESESMSIDVKAAEEFLEILDKLIAEENYLPEQILSVDETCPFWKQMAEKTSIYKVAKLIPDFKDFKDRVPVLLGGTVAGYQLL